MANEFFDAKLGRMGGFGWAARQVARCFHNHSESGVEVVFLSAEMMSSAPPRETTVHGARLLLNQKERFGLWGRLQRERFDLLLTIDYRPGYRRLCMSLPRTPLIVWVRDPRSADDVARIRTLRLPGQDSSEPQGIGFIDCTSLARVVSAARWLRRPVLYATPAPHLAEKVAGTYGVQPPEVHFLPNIVDVSPRAITKDPRPSVVFLGRLDPIKRPWLFTELASRFPQAEFFLLGQAHVHGEGAWESNRLPANVHLMGHLDGDGKESLLSSAWVLVNTSIHEALATSFLEALARETPLLSCQDPGGVVSRFGIYTGRWNGTGMEGLPALAEGLQRLLDDADLRARLGKTGRQWVAETHTEARFLEAFESLCARAGVRR